MITRRRFLSLSLAAAAGRLLATRQLLAATRTPARHLVFIYLAGGPSQLDTFDPKPGTRIGGPFRAIRTRIAGVSFSEHLPRLAERADRLAVIRSLTSTEGSHQRARYLLHTAYPPNPSVRHASIGSALSHEIAPRELALPAYVALGGPGEGAGYLGPAHAPFVVRSNPGNPIENVTSPPDVDERRLTARLELVELFDRRFALAGAKAEVEARRAMVERARTMMRSPSLAAFQIATEPDRVRAAYGDTVFGKRCLIARRLVEQGVSAIEIELSGWDSHTDNFQTHARLCAELDAGVSALVDDLAGRGLLDRTLILVAGEFGRTPKINQKDGRDHHPRCFAGLLAGGGIRAGQCVGATTDDGDAVATRPVTIPDLFATAYRLLGIDGARMFTSNDRPLTLAGSGKPIAELI